MGPYFAFFACVWIYMRHYLNLRILWSVLNEFVTVGPYELNWETQQYKCWISQYITFGLLSALQALNLFWLFYILRIAYRFVVYRVAEDEREEGEGEDEEVEGEAADAPLLAGKIARGEEESFAEKAATVGANGAAVHGGSQRKTRSKKA